MSRSTESEAEKLKRLLGDPNASWELAELIGNVELERTEQERIRREERGSS